MSLRIHLDSVLGFVFLVLAGGVAAQEFRSIAAPGAILYDAPSTQAGKLFILTAGYPVEVVVKIEGWSRVRDHGGQFAWAQNGSLTERPSVMVVARDVLARKEPSESAAAVFAVEQEVCLELIEGGAGWARVRHADGATGYIKTSQLWGL